MAGGSDGNRRGPEEEDTGNRGWPSDSVTNPGVFTTVEPTSRVGIVGPTPILVKGPDRLIGRLVVLMGDAQGRRFTLPRTTALVGRSEECDVQLEDSKISRKHARITHRDDAWQLEDLESRNGTLVNGTAVRKHRLAAGDRIQLSGDTLLLFTQSDPREDLLAHRQQMEVIGQLAAGIAHDFNNLLNVITASTAHLQQLPGETTLDDAEVLECRLDIEAAAGRASELTSRLLSVARRREKRMSGTLRAQTVDVTRLCEDVLQLIQRTFDSRIRIEASIAQGLFVRGDHPSLHRMLMNLCFNARDAMPDGGNLTLSARRDERRKENDLSMFSPTPEIVLEVKDTGIGMDAETQERAFEPFFTTKENNSGSGLGLATVFEVSTSHGGYTDLNSVVGRGTRFSVHIPAEAAPEGGQERPQRKRASTWDRIGTGRIHGRVLVVDDQELVRRSLGRLVRASGHQVSFAKDGEDALAVYQRPGERPDVVLLDLDMPRLGGAECLEQLLAIDPEARVVFVSGYYDEPRKERLLAAGACDFLGKPIEASSLRRAIELALRLSAEGRSEE